ncbi:MAG: hypothetical protein PHT07_18410 [Paludibacter sp.]|nr:hypothetical protein [Paludibacter sp.]
MTTSELKLNLHTLIEKINDDSFLLKCYTLILRMKDSKEGILWNKLSKEEQDEITLIEKESLDSSTLISNNDMKLKHKKWL